MIKAFKAGTHDLTTLVPTNSSILEGVFYHHTLTAAGTCPNDPLAAISGKENVEDDVSVAVLLAAGHTGMTLQVWSGGVQIGGTQNLVTGYNPFTISGMRTGTQVVKVFNSAGTLVAQGTGNIQVVSEAALCNYNFQVVPIDVIG